jgi:outer membrane immunogenic protein
LVAAASPGTSFGNGGFFGGRDNNRDGWLAGGQVGFNWQMPGSGLVLGVEADIQWADFGNNNDNGFGGFGGFNAFGVAVPGGTSPTLTPGLGVASIALPGVAGNVAFFNNTGGGFGGSGNSRDWFGTARVRVGWAWDRLLVYATGGIAFTDDSNNNRGFLGFGGNGFANGAAVPLAFYRSTAAAAAGALVGPSGGGFFFGGNNDNNNIGWALGGGAEWAFTNNLTLKLEGLWLGFDRGNNIAFGGGCCSAGQVVGVTNTGAPVVATATTTGFGKRDDADVFIARVGLNYKFGL